MMGDQLIWKGLAAHRSSWIVLLQPARNFGTDGGRVAALKSRPTRVGVVTGQDLPAAAVPSIDAAFIAACPLVCRYPEQRKWPPYPPTP
jgi:hypothetical protein